MHDLAAQVHVLPDEVGVVGVDDHLVGEVVGGWALVQLDRRQFAAGHPGPDEHGPGQAGVVLFNADIHVCPFRDYVAGASGEAVLDP